MWPPAAMILARRRRDRSGRAAGCRAEQAILALGGAEVRVLCGLVALLLVGCGGRGDERDVDRWLAELGESAVTAFLQGRDDPSVPAGALSAQTLALFSGDVQDVPGGQEVWQVRHPRADAVALPLLQRDRAAAIEYKADVVIQFEQRYCAVAPSGELQRCEPWQVARCCDQVWKLSRGAWRVERPPVRQ